MDVQYDHLISQLAEEQHGVVARRQLNDLGIDPAAITRRIHVGRLVEQSPRVLRVAGAPVTSLGRVMMAVLSRDTTFVNYM